MAKRHHRVVRRRVEETEEEPEVIEEDEEVALEEEPEEEEEPKPVRRGRKFVEAEDEPEPAPIKTRSRKTKVAEEEEIEEAPVPAPSTVKVKKVDTQVAENILTGILESLEDGKSITITRMDGNKWQVTSGGLVAAGGRRRGKEYWDAVRNPEYTTWKQSWNQKTFDEKRKYAKKIGAKWESHEDPRIEVMRITQAVREKEGVEKYKPEYRDRGSRARLRG